jgi:hypothetical protein
MEMSGQLHTPSALLLEIESPVAIGYEAGWHQSWSGHSDGKEKSPFITPVRNWTLVIQLIA